jgi:hypothetical protein
VSNSNADRYTNTLDSLRVQRSESRDILPRSHGYQTTICGLARRMRVSSTNPLRERRGGERIFVIPFNLLLCVIYLLQSGGPPPIEDWTRDYRPEERD